MLFQRKGSLENGGKHIIATYRELWHLSNRHSYIMVWAIRTMTTIHNMVTEHFTEWYRAPGPPTDWPSLLTDRAAFHALADSKGISTHLTRSLWEAFTSPLQLSSLQQDLRQALSCPPLPAGVPSGHPSPQREHCPGSHRSHIKYRERMAIHCDGTGSRPTLTGV